jgi:hypothetical protein
VVVSAVVFRSSGSMSVCADEVHDVAMRLFSTMAAANYPSQAKPAQLVPPSARHRCTSPTTPPARPGQPADCLHFIFQLPKLKLRIASQNFRDFSFFFFFMNNAFFTILEPANFDPRSRCSPPGLLCWTQEDPNLRSGQNEKRWVVKRPAHNLGCGASLALAMWEESQ